MANSPQTAHLALRVGLAFAFLYPPISALSDPVSWAAYFPAFVHALLAQAGLPISPLVLLHAFGVLQVIIALWLLSGWRIRLPSALAVLMLVAIVAFNLNQLDVLFRDIALAAIAIALVLWPSPSAPRVPPL